MFGLARTCRHCIDLGQVERGTEGCLPWAAVLTCAHEDAWIEPLPDGLRCAAAERAHAPQRRWLPAGDERLARVQDLGSDEEAGADHQHGGAWERMSGQFGQRPGIPGGDPPGAAEPCCGGVHEHGAGGFQAVLSLSTGAVGQAVLGVVQEHQVRLAAQVASGLFQSSVETAWGKGVFRGAACWEVADLRGHCELGQQIAGCLGQDLVRVEAQVVGTGVDRGDAEVRGSCQERAFVTRPV